MCLAMAVKGFLLLVLVVLHATTFFCAQSVLAQMASAINRADFPDGFVFGASTSAYQVEGAANEGGKGPSIWDNFTHTYPEKIKDRSNGDVATDSYHRYKEDVGLLVDMGMDAYKFSISWSRILPKGGLAGGVNKVAIEYYNNLINEVISKGLKPYVVLFQSDTPQFLEDKYDGFLSREIVEDFKDFADICFWEFGDRVKNWITVKGPWVFSSYGYASSTFAPGRCSPWEAGQCSQGDSGTEPYIVTHILLLAHAAAVQLYRTKYQEYQNGSVGIILSSHWFLPYNSTYIGDALAARSALDFMFGWHMDPLTRGDYPVGMRVLLQDRLPKFTEEESRLVNGSFDFIGINYYTGLYARLVNPPPERPSYNTDSHADLTAYGLGGVIGPQATGSTWVYVYPQGLKELLNHIRINYNNPVIYIAENGVGDINNVTHPTPEALNDTMRVESNHEHRLAVLEAIRSGADVRGYFAWSLLDNFEWSDGFTTRFGLYFVDYENDLKRTPKRSAKEFKEFLNPQKWRVVEK